ncbi:tetratricopeptide repeat protein [Nocardia arthritidis]|uniref:Tetratricopeptide repeat protein n=1 Tax=Nocardia arthritidis TaxID=228602 RepID=A0A6G9YF33_9NOCA|nr:tetratricopeptide repeat protein [Nocardia arthritidis]QIS11831.1 tetratricopeptide repeat protein [Nocardia arthritidis]
MKFPWRRRQSVSNTVVFRDNIQIADVTGDVTISSEHPRYRIEAMPVAAPAVAPERARAQPSRLLHPRYQVVPFIGRHDEIAELHGWMGRPEPLGVRLIHAGGGQGKTRLTTHYAAKAAESGWMIWRAVYSPDSAVAQQSLELGDRRGVLVLVDYADRWLLSHLRSLIAKLHFLTVDPGIRVRVLLVARSSAHWWPALANDLAGDFDIDAEATELTPLGAQIDRQILFASAATAFAAAMGASHDPGAGSPPEIELDRPGFSSVLSLHLAALVAVDSRLRGAAMPGDPAGLSGYLLRREYTHWTRLSEVGQIRARPETMRRVVWLATLIGAVTPHLAEGILAHVGLASTPEKATELTDDHLHCYPPEDPHTVLEGLHPDRLGEDFIALSIPGRPPAPDTIASDAWTGAALRRLLTDETGAREASLLAWWTPQVVTGLVETARRWPHVASEVLFPLIRQHPHVLVAAGDATVERFARLDGIELPVLTALESCYPRHTRYPRHTHEQGSAFMVALISGKAYEQRLAAARGPVELARVHRLHAQRLNDAGSGEAARIAAAAVGLLRAETTVDETEFAAALTQLGIAEFRLGETEAAVEHAGAALSLYPNLPAAARKELLTDIATLSGEYGDWLTGSGADDEALAMTETAVRVGRTLAEDNPDDNSPLPALAGALHNRGRQLFLMRRDDEALAATEEAVRLRRRLVDWEPYDYLGDLAESLRLLNEQLRLAGQTERALSTIREAALILQELARRKPTDYLFDWVTAQRRRIDQMLEAGQRADAVEPTEQVAHGLRALIEWDPDAHRPVLAEMLLLLGELLAEQQRDDESAAADEEALSLCRQLFADHREARLPHLATALGSVSARRAAADRGDRAVALAAEAAPLYRELAWADVRYEPIYAGFLYFYDDLLTSLGRESEALPVNRDAVALYRRMAQRDSAYQSDLAAALRKVARRTVDSTDEEGILAAQEAVEIYRGLAQNDSIRSRGDLADALVELGTKLRAVGRTPQAERASTEAFDRFRMLFDDDPDRYRAGFADALYGLALDLAESKELAEAIERMAHSLMLFRELADDDPSFRSSQAAAAEGLAGLQVRNQTPFAAIRPADEAIYLYRELVEYHPEYLPRLAATLHLAAKIGMLTERVWPGVYPTILESIQIYEYLDQQAPGDYGRELADAQTTLTGVLRYFQAYRAWVKAQEAAQASSNPYDPWIT